MATLNFCRALKTKYGYSQFGFFEGRWRFNNLAIVNDIKERYPNIMIDADVVDDITAWELKQKEKELTNKKINKIKNATYSDLKISKIKGELYPYQKLGVEFLVLNKGRAILADTMGLGKTVQALAYVVHEKLTKTLVVCPASVKYSWESEVKKWTSLTPYVINSKSIIDPVTIEANDIFIINYDIVKKFLPLFKVTRFDSIILDEFHYVKNSKAQRTRAIMELARKITSVILLSGTPLLSRPVELFNALNLIDPIVWNDWFKFTSRYCAGHQDMFGWNTKGASHIDELQKKIAPYFLRRMKEKVLKELPPKRFISLPTELYSEQKPIYDLAEIDFIEYLRTIKKDSDSDIKRKSQALKLIKLNELRQITSRGKISAAKDVIDNIIDSGEKIVVFSVYNEPLEELKKIYKNNAFLLTGSSTDIERKTMREEFQKKSGPPIFLGGMKSAGVGITLTEASNVLFIDFAWVPADHAQAIDRIHRIGQTAENVTAYQLFCHGTIDEHMQEVLVKKQKIFDAIMNGDISKDYNVNILNDVLKKYENMKMF
jgi:SWI/SNF-related matrix-associated actin-dependent regulator 1 of chromatin subfamily A